MARTPFTDGFHLHHFIILVAFMIFRWGMAAAAASATGDKNGDDNHSNEDEGQDHSSGFKVCKGPSVYTYDFPGESAYES
jgi:hypothetical protein